MKNTCPHCGLPCLGGWRKLTLGPAANAQCRACHCKVGVSVGPAFAAFMPCIVLIASVKLLPGVAVIVGAASAALALTFGLYWWWVPLVKHGMTDQLAVRRARGEASMPPRS